MLAAIYLTAGDGQRAVSLLKDAARLEPGDFRPWYALGKVYHDLGNLEESAAAYTAALKRNPPAAEARESRIGRIRAVLDANHPEQASEDLSELTRQTPDDPQVLGLAARQARDRGRRDEALALARRARGRAHQFRRTACSCAGSRHSPPASIGRRGPGEGPCGQTERSRRPSAPRPGPDEPRPDPAGQGHPGAGQPGQGSHRADGSPDQGYRPASRRSRTAMAHGAGGDGG